MIDDVKRRFGELLVELGVGYFLPSVASDLGLGMIAYDNLPTYKRVVDAAWNGAREAGATNETNPWRNGGAIGVGKVAGLGLVSLEGYKIAEGKKPGLGKLAFGAGLMLDGPLGGDWGKSAPTGMAGAGASW